MAPIEEDDSTKAIVEFFGPLVGIVDKKSMELFLPKDATVGSLIDTLISAIGPLFGELLRSQRLVLLVQGNPVDAKDPGRRLLESNEDAAEVTVCLLPMIAGGS